MTVNISSTVKSLLTKLKAGAEADMTGEELLLLSKSVQALAENEDFEQALVAVAEQHLNTAEQSMTNAVAQMVLDIDAAKGDINSAKQALDGATTNLDSQADNLSVVAQVRELLEGVRNREGGQLGNSHNLTVLDGDNEIMDEITSICPQQSVIFSDNGQVNIYSAPQAQATGTPSGVQHCHNWYELASGSDFHNATFTRKNYMSCSTNTARTSYTHRYGYYPVCGEYPLAKSDNAEDIKFTAVCADYTTNSQTHANWRGIGLFSDADYGVAVGHYNDALLTDKYGRKATQTSNRTNHIAVTAFYDNSKNCLVVVESLKVWYLYNDGWVDPNIATFADLTVAQAWVDAQEDMFLVALRTQGTASSYNPLKYNSHYNKTDNDRQYSEYQAMKVGYITGTTGANADPHGYTQYGGLDYFSSECGTDERNNTAAGWTGSQTFLWETEAKNLVPVFNELVMELVPRGALSANTHTAAIEWAKVKLSAKAIRMDTQAILGECVHIVQAKVHSSYFGVHNIDIPHYNPYADAWLFSHSQYRNSSWYYKLARLSRANRYHGIKGEYK
ncbi:hypothetical protein SG34_025590 [Thalassomonas viridans]|uniref:Uncharacterized protein n=1 Tax=Thalassomonas viridans TaxID=137584 RepID=A0AAF0C8E6_9GAMM|nr:hypothetical protein [Thalassomonas viridans]WDE04663.1 hypothetical protein SG34_025590 [Thalassomonas viridans]